MKKLTLSLIIAAVLLLSVAVFVAAQQPTPPKGPEPTLPPITPTPTSIASPPTAAQLDRTLLAKIEPQLLKKLLVAPSDDPVPFIAYLTQQADLQAAAAGPLGAQGQPDMLARRQAIVTALQETARRSQPAVLQHLANLPGGGPSGQSMAATSVKSLWIVNAVAASGPLETILSLAARPDVEIVRLDKAVQIDQPSLPENPKHSKAILPLRQTPEWNIAKIRADLVHNALGIDGGGVVVANIDTGVDWLHPDLQSGYRGYRGSGKLPVHSGNWYDSTGEGATYPVDADGHGSHTMGTIAGQNGIGVAPGAQWIAVKAFNSSGNALNSWLHEAFQWVLAPNGDPALAPDIVNNSWGSSSSSSTEFQADIDALLNAGILPIFSAGNSGPSSSTVNSPGSLDNAFAVGATDINDAIANFSSRGPSPWGKLKPQVSAPGKDIRSAAPGGAYANLNGTSMAAPHVAGLAALILQAAPVLSSNLSGVTEAITTTAIPLGGSIPNNNFGWGRIDAYNAVMAVASVGTLRGVISDAVTSAGVNNALVKMTPTLGGTTIETRSDAGGSYVQGLAGDTYEMAVSAFGYSTATASLVTVTTNTTTIQNFNLTPLPSGTVAGLITSKSSGAPLPATVSIDSTPVSTSTQTGNYNLKLPVGTYTVTVVASNYRVAQAVAVEITEDNTTSLDFQLDDAPSILLVDSGHWYQESKLAYFETALQDARYTHDTIQIASPFSSPSDVPSSETLQDYDIVIWSSPLDSPGYIEADEAIEEYLDEGGKLLLTGQDIAYYDGGGSFFGSAPYLRNYLKTTYVRDDAGIDDLSGVAGQPFESLSFSVNGGDGANNQLFPDVVANADADFAGPLLRYNGSDDLAGLHAGRCVPYRALFLSFGLEGISSSSDRSQVIEQSIDWLMESPPTHGVELSPATETQVGNFGGTVSHTMRLRNTGSSTDTMLLNLTNAGPYNWPASSLPASAVLGPCASQQFTVTVQVPLNQSWHVSDTFTIQAQSSSVVTQTDRITRTTKTPAPVLLVDDDRWYSFADAFKSALDANGIDYDFWLVPKSWSGSVPPSPPLETLQMYPMVVWYTAYDWFQPLTLTEENRLAAYLDGGGRLFFSSQDFLYRHLINHGGSYGSFAQDYLGILAHTEDLSTTQTVGQIDNPVGDFLGPYPLTFPSGYRNWTDTLTPTALAQPATLNQSGRPNGLTHAGTGTGGSRWRTNFLAYGPELLSQMDRARLMQRSLGWLSWLGGSTTAIQANAVTNGATISYTAIISNDGWDTISTAHFTATFPGYLTPGSASPQMQATGSAFTWSGSLAPAERRILTYTAQINQSLPVGTVITQTSWLHHPEHRILFDRIADVRAAPDLSGSTMQVTPEHDVQPNDALTYTIVLKNSGLVNAAMVTTTSSLPKELVLLEAVSIQGTVINSAQGITWTTPLARDSVATLTFRATITGKSAGSINHVAAVNDGVNETLMLSTQATFKLTLIYLPTVFKNSQ